MRIPSILLASAVLLLASCDDDESTAPADSAYPSRRTISATLRAKCPDLNAARAAEGAYRSVQTEQNEPAVQVEQNDARRITYGIYDSTGALVTQGAYDIPATQTSYSPYIGWNGKDAAGNKVPTGLYFVFLDVHGQAGTLLQSSSDCIGVRSAS